MNLHVQTEGNTGEFVELVVAGLEYTGPKDLTQYFIRHTNMTLGVDKEVPTNVPTGLLVIISFFTNFFKPFFFVIIMIKIQCLFHVTQIRKPQW